LTQLCIAAIVVELKKFKLIVKYKTITQMRERQLVEIVLGEYIGTNFSLVKSVLGK